eukprot:gene1928-1167_t
MEYIIALGDSNTEWGFSSTWLSRLSHYYSRRATVINSGQRGYNSRWLRQMLEDRESREVLLPSYARRPLFVTIMLGTNDLAHPSTGQHVPLPEFISNLKAIISIVKRECQPKGGIFVMTPPPVDEGFCPSVHAENQRSQDVQVYVPNRRFDDSRRYRQAIVDYFNGEKLQDREHEYVYFVDVQTVILQHGDPTFLFTPSEEITYNPDAPWTRLFPDGIHLGEVAGELVFTTLLDAIRHAPKANMMLPISLPLPIPDYTELVSRVVKNRTGRRDGMDGSFEIEDDMPNERMEETKISWYERKS